MTSGRKLLLLALSLLLPATLLVCTHAFVAAQMHVAANDRAIVWAQGDARGIATARARIESHAVFSSGMAIAGSPEDPAPAPCDAGAYELSFGHLSRDDAHAAREELELIARESGLAACASHRFRLNDPGADDAAGQWRFAGQHLLVFLVVPAGICLCLYWMFRDQLGLPTLRSGQGFGGKLLLGLGGALAAAMLSFLVHTAAGEAGFDARAAQLPAPGFATLAMVLSLTLGSAMIEEVAYRSWLITLSERVLGRWPAAVFSTCLFTLSYQPANVADAFALVALGGVCSALYLRTRSLAAPITAHAGYEALKLALGAAL